jgi:hypothetical protein
VKTFRLVKCAEDESELLFEVRLTLDLITRLRGIADFVANATVADWGLVQVTIDLETCDLEAAVTLNSAPYEDENLRHIDAAVDNWVRFSMDTVVGTPVKKHSLLTVNVFGAGVHFEYYLDPDKTHAEPYHVWVELSFTELDQLIMPAELLAALKEEDEQ